VNFCKSEKQILALAVKYARNVEKCNSFYVIRRTGVYNGVGSHVRVFSTWPTHPELVIIVPSTAFKRTV